MFSLILKMSLVGVFAWNVQVLAEAPDPNPARFAKYIESFEKWDKKNSFPGNAILFVGSSSLRLWQTAIAFPGKPIINRGFGGSEISDVLHYYDQVVKPYKPLMIFLYGGDNDINRGKNAEQVFQDYKEFVELVHANFPETIVFFISIKPSVQRWKKWPMMAEVNNLVRKYAENHPNLGYVDLASPLFDGDGKLKNVFVADGLHLNAYGYQLWQEALTPYLE